MAFASSIGHGPSMCESTPATVEMVLRKQCHPSVYEHYCSVTEAEKDALRRGFCGSLDGMVNASAQRCMMAALRKTEEMAGAPTETSLREAMRGAQRSAEGVEQSVEEEEERLEQLISDRGMARLRGWATFDEVKSTLRKWGAPRSQTYQEKHEEYWRSQFAPAVWGETAVDVMGKEVI